MFIDRIKRLLLWVKGRWVFGHAVEVFGNFTVVNPANVRIGARCAINHQVFILGRTGITIGDDVVMSARCMILDGSLNPATFATTDERRYLDAPVRIGDGAWIGAGAIILPGVAIGDLSIVGAGAVVTKDVPSHTIVAGNPARAIGKCGHGSAS